MLKICLGWCGASSLLVLGFYFSGDLLTILSAFEDSRSLIGGSDVVHCVWVPLIGTTVAEFWACGSLVGSGYAHFPTLCTISGDIGGPSIIVL